MSFPQVFVDSSAQLASVNDASALHPQGTLCWDYSSTYKSWRLMKYVQLTGAVAGTAGAVCRIGDAYGTVTADINDDQLSTESFGGVCLGTVTIDYYCWVCVGGIAPCTGDAVVNAGESVVPAAAVDGQMDTMAGTEEDHVFGVALVDATTAAPTVPVYIYPVF